MTTSLTSNSRAVALVKPGGRLAYVTCSMLIRENEATTDAFEAAHPDFAPLPVAAALASPHLMDAARERLAAMLGDHAVSAILTDAEIASFADYKRRVDPDGLIRSTPRNARRSPILAASTPSRSASQRDHPPDSRRSASSPRPFAIAAEASTPARRGLRGRPGHPRPGPGQRAVPHG